MDKFQSLCGAGLCLLNFFTGQALAQIATTVLPAIQVTKPVLSQTLATTQAQTTIITQQQIQQSGVLNVQQLLAQQASVQLQDINGDGNQVSVSMRGFGENAGQNSLILLNGIPLNQVGLSVVDLNRIPLASILWVEVIEGSAGVRFGDQAVGGVINIITKTQQATGMQVSTTQGSYQMQIYRQALQAQFENGLYATAAHKYLTTQHYREHNAEQDDQWFGKIGYHYHKGGRQGWWQLNYLLGVEHLQLPGALTAEQVAQNRRQAQSTTNFTDNHYQFWSFQHHYHLTQNWLSIIHASHRVNNYEGVIDGPLTQRLTVDTLQPELKGKLGKGFYHSGVFLSQGQYRLQSAYGITEDRQHKYALFSEYKYPWSTRLSAQVGGRLAAFDNQLTDSQQQKIHRHAAITSLALRYGFANHWSGFLRRAGSYRFPKSDELAWVKPGTSSLKTQTGVSYEAGVNGAYHHWLLKTMIYQLNLRNEIVFLPLKSTTELGYNQNLPATQRRGLSFSAHRQWLKKLRLSLQYNYVSAQFTEGVFKHKHIPFVANHRLTTAMSYRLNGNWRIFGEAHYTGSRYISGDNSNRFKRLPEFTLVNVGLQFKYQQVDALLRVNNIFNNLHNAYGVLATAEQQAYFYPAPGRTISLTLGVSLA